MGDSRLRRVGIDGRVVASGLIAGAGFLAAMVVDLAIVKNHADDLVLLGGLTPVEERRWRPVGAILHFVNSAGLAVAYTRLRPHIPKPGNRYLQGLIFIQFENLVLYPIVLVICRFHPARRAGRLADFRSPVVFVQEVFRHAVYGLILGALLDRDELGVFPCPFGQSEHRPGTGCDSPNSWHTRQREA